MHALTVSKIIWLMLSLPPAIKLVVVWRNLSTDWSRFTVFLSTHWVYRIFEGIPA